jgi:predicted metal-binding membrane protein
MNAATMAAMMLPSAVPAALRCGRPSAAAWLAVSYVALWAAVGLAVVALVPMSAAVVIAAGLYELTPLKRACRRRCREHVRSGLELGLYCVGSSLGLMAAFVALGAMGIEWMAVAAVAVLAQKLVPPVAAIDVPVAVGIIVLGVLA